jgi:predicted TIM-barrel fold metal-dependent hydrolase
VYSCFFKDSVGVRLLDLVGEDNVMFETDYPHQDGTWPHSRQAAAEQFGHLPQDQIEKIARGNAINLLGLDLPAAPRSG